MTNNKAEELLARITSDPDIFEGKPIIRGKRLAVEHVLTDLAAGETPESILENFPFLEAEDIQACLLFASRELGHSWKIPTPREPDAVLD
jgi:uncharacterized protein (DUF433 family)